MSGFSSDPSESRTHLRIREDPVMPAIVEFPTIVQEAVKQFGPLLANEPERTHLAEYLTGLMVAGRKNVSAINREFADTTDQSCLNRWLTAAKWDAAELNRRRLEWLQQDPSTRDGARGTGAVGRQAGRADRPRRRRPRAVVLRPLDPHRRRGPPAAAGDPLEA